MARDEADSLYRAVVALDPAFARVALALARAELHRDRSADAAELARQARTAAPRFWPAAAAEIEALRARGLERHADQVLEQTLAAARAGRRGPAICWCWPISGRRSATRPRPRGSSPIGCAAAMPARPSPSSGCERRGDLAQSAAALQQRLEFVSDRNGTRAELAAVRLAMGEAAVAAAELRRAGRGGAPGQRAAPPPGRCLRGGRRRADRARARGGRHGGPPAGSCFGPPGRPGDGPAAAPR